MNNKHYFLAINRTNHLGPRTLLKLLQHWPNLAELFSLSSDQMAKAGLSDSLIVRLKQVDLNQIEPDLRWEETINNHLISWEDKAYPVLLKEIYAPPLVLYAKGQLSAFTKPPLAIVGTRNPSPSGSDIAFSFARELSEQGLAIISGLALGIDAQAHHGCLAAQGQTVAVLGTGIDRIYPYQHRRLAEEIIEAGLILSEFPLGTPPKTGHFPRRNRIISGLSLSILVIEAAMKSGSLITARYAIEQNRDVLAVPSSIYNQQAQGCHFLLQQGAKLITTVKDVLDELKMNPNKQVPTLASEDRNQVNCDSLIQCIGMTAATVDEICQKSGLSIENVICDLADLELAGLIKAVPGGYMRCI